MTKRYLSCCVCGNGAGKFEQHWNRDTGWGICHRCVAQEAAYLAAKELEQLYGKPGVNYEVPMVRHNGRRFKLLAVFPNTTAGTADANAYMERTPGTSVLVVSDGIYLADAADLGEPITD